MPRPHLFVPRPQTWQPCWGWDGHCVSHCCSPRGPSPSQEDCLPPGHTRIHGRLGFCRLSCPHPRRGRAHAVCRPSSLPSLCSHRLHTPDLLITGHHTALGVWHQARTLLPPALLPLSLWSLSLPPTFPALPSCLPSLSNRGDRPRLEHTLYSSNCSVSSFLPGKVPSPERVLSPESTHVLMLPDTSGENPECVIGLLQLPNCFWCCLVVWWICLLRFPSRSPR